MTPPHAAAPRALSLYPRRYRETYGAEIHEMYQDAVRGAGRWARCREELDIAAHALRLRTRTGSGHLLGRFILAAAPYALAAAAALAVARLLFLVVGTGETADASLILRAGAPTCLLTLAAAALAALGRWPAVRACAALGLLAAAALPGTDARFLPLLAVLVLLPPGVTPARTDRRLAVVLALALGLPWLPLAAAGAAVAAGYGMLGALAPTVVVLVIRSAAKDGGARHAFAILLATAPWTLAPATTPAGAAVALVPAVLAYGLGAAVRAGRRRVRA
ncbi:hypothetical protein ACF1DY_09745 [Streptomyces albus]